MRWLDNITDSKHMSLSKFQEFMMDNEALHPAVHGVTKSQTQLSDCILTLKCTPIYIRYSKVLFNSTFMRYLEFVAIVQLLYRKRVVVQSLSLI